MIFFFEFGLQKDVLIKFVTALSLVDNAQYNIYNFLCQQNFMIFKFFLIILYFQNSSSNCLYSLR